MINYKLFEFASAPRTASTWFVTACHIVGLGTGGYQHIPYATKEVHAYFPEVESTVPRVTIVRHPCDWLASYFKFVLSAKLHLISDALGQLSRDFEIKSFDHFVELVLDHHPGIVGRVFDAYKADVYLRTDSINQGFYDLVTSLGVDEIKAKPMLTMGPHNSSGNLGFNAVKWDDQELCDRFLDSESDCLNRYDFKRQLTEV